MLGCCAQSLLLHLQYAAYEKPPLVFAVVMHQHLSPGMSLPAMAACIFWDEHVVVAVHHLPVPCTLLGCTHLPIVIAAYLGMNLYFQKVKKTYRPLSTYIDNSKNKEAGSFTADLDSAEEV